MQLSKLNSQFIKRSSIKLIHFFKNNLVYFLAIFLSAIFLPWIVKWSASYLGPVLSETQKDVVQWFCRCVIIYLLIQLIYTLCTRKKPTGLISPILYLITLGVYLYQRDLIVRNAESSGFTPTELFIPVEFFTQPIYTLECVVLGIASIIWLHKWSQKKTIQEPTKDTLGRKTIAEKLGEKICNLPTQSGAYNIGVYGEFGSGKTVFLEYLEQYLHSRKPSVIWYRPLEFSPESRLQEFLLLIADSTKQPHLKNSIHQYADRLEGIDSWIDKALQFFGKKEYSATSMKSEIVKKLSDSDQKYVVIVDELDRMQSDDAMMTLNMLRISGDFPNIIFVIAVDFTHLTSIIHRGGINNPELYLQKYFHEKIQLPKIPYDNIVDYINSEVKSKWGLSKENTQLVIDYFNASKKLRLGLLTREIKPPSIQKILNNLRITQTFIETTSRRISAIGQNNIAILDLIKLEVIHTASTIAYEILNAKRDDILDWKTDNRQMRYAEIKTEKLREKIDNDDKTEIVIGLFEEIFPNLDKLVQSNQDPRSIRFMANFPKYFGENMAN